jgi:tripartite-type tricarboxylate transporter receptor subunit TctC
LFLKLFFNLTEHIMKLKHFVLAVFSIASLQAMAQTKNITLISAFPPGGVTDAIARMVGPGLAKSTGQTVVVDNITGASGSIAANKMFGLPTDGTTIMMVSSSETIMPPLMMKSVKFKAEDFRLLINGPTVPLAIVARSGLPVNNLEELLAYARNPANKPLSYGSLGVGSIAHIGAEHFAKLTGIGMTHVPYRGGAPVVNDLLGNNVDLSFFPFAGGMVQLAETGKVKVLGLSLDESLPQYAKYALATKHPQLKEFVHLSWQSMAVPKSTPLPVAEKLAQQLNEIFHEPEMQAFAAKNGSFVPKALSLVQVEAQYNAEIARTRALAKAINLQAE